MFSQDWINVISFLIWLDLTIWFAVLVLFVIKKLDEKEKAKKIRKMIKDLEKRVHRLLEVIDLKAEAKDE